MHVLYERQQPAMLRWQVLLGKMRVGLIQLQSIADFAVGPVCELNFEGCFRNKTQSPLPESSRGHVQWRGSVWDSSAHILPASRKHRRWK